MPPFYRFIRASLNPLIALDCAGMLVAGSFLLYKGYWQSLWTVIIVFSISKFFFPFLMMPAAFLSGLMQIFAPRKPLVGYVLQACSMGWLIFIISFWSTMAFDFVAPLMHAPLMTWAVLVWGVSGAVAPWAVFASNDRDNLFFTMMVFVAQVGCIVAAAVALSHDLSFWGRFWVIAGVMTALMTAQLAYEEITSRKKKTAA